MYRESTLFPSANIYKILLTSKKNSTNLTKTRIKKRTDKYFGD